MDNETYLVAFVNSFTPTADFKTAGGQVAHAIYLALQQRPEISVDRVANGGSIGKGTALISSDFDMFIFLNGVQPPFPGSIQESFMKAIQQARLPGAKINFRGKGSVAVKASAEFANFSLEFDLVPASTQAALDKVKYGQMTEQQISSSLTEPTIAFFKKVPDQIKKTIRLAKIWNRNVNLGLIKLHGRTSIIELVCLHANLDFAGANLETQFKNFLEAMKNLKSAKIILSDTYHELNIPANIRDQRPLIMDVANPYDNFGKQLLGSGAIKYFTNAVETTLAKIKNSRPSAEWF